MPALRWAELSLSPLTAGPRQVLFGAVCELSAAWSSVLAGGWDCVPVLLVDFCEVLSIAACRRLGGARSWP